MDLRTYIPDSLGENESYNSDYLPEFPIHLDIEMSSRCNLNCVFCDKQPLIKAGQLGDMQESLFTKIIDEASANGCESIGLSYRGEPLLNKSIVNMIAYAKKRGIGWVSFCTNGMLLIPKTSEKLIDAGLDEIKISAQGGDTDSFEHSRLGSNFFVVTKNVEYLMAAREKRGVDYPVICVQAVDLPELDKKCYMSYWGNRTDKIIIVPYEETTEKHIINNSNWRCPQPWKRLTIEWDGTILPCNNDDTRINNLGNANDITVKEAWMSNTITYIRHNQKKGRYDLCEDCKGCPFFSNALSSGKRYLETENKSIILG